MKNYFEYKNYIGTVNLSMEDRVFYGTVHGLKDLVTFEGETFEELESSFRDAVDDYLVVCEELGKEPDKAYKGQFNVRISPELHRQITMKGISEGMNLNQAVEQAIKEYVYPKETVSTFIAAMSNFRKQVRQTTVVNGLGKWQENKKETVVGFNNKEIVYGGAAC
ncbi:MAG: toxin-antitoxin system HicB family antitoxin [Clostridiales bacterium]|jgi:predicted HicB family RNase H-like nuclease|nr:toxin-antitoxin system HicB family antitoxin [Clostridiales bacterium]